MIVAGIIAGNLIVDRSREEGDDTAARVAFTGVSSQTPVGVVFQLGELVDAARAEAAEEAAAAARARTEARQQRRQQRLKLREKFGDLPGSVTRETLNSIAECESGGDPEIVSSNGLYHGKYQFHPDTWESVGGEGLPSEAPEAEQDYRAALLYERSGPGQWPVCGQ